MTANQDARNVNFEAGELLSSNKAQALARSSWRAVMTALTTLFRGKGTKFEAEVARFIGPSFRPFAGSGSNLGLRPGLALYHDSDEADPWLGVAKPFYLPSDTSLPIPVNNDPSGDDRIDAVLIRPVQNDQNPSESWVVDPQTKNKAKKKIPEHVERDFELTVVEGSPAQNPSPPDPPAGNWSWLAEVLRPNGVDDVTDSHITDRRGFETTDSNIVDGLQLSNALVNQTLHMAADAYLTWRDSGRNLEMSLFLANAEHQMVLQELNTTTFTWEDGDLQLGRLRATDEVQTDTIQGDAADKIDVQDSGGTSGAAEIKSRTTLVGWGHWSWDAGNGSWNAVETVNMSYGSNPGAGTFDFPIDSQPGPADAMVVAEILEGSSGLASDEFHQCEAWGDDDGSGNLQAQLHTHRVDMSVPEFTRNRDPSDGANVKLRVYKKW